MKQMQDFDMFTRTIGDNDPIRIEALERGNIRDYWGTAEGWAKRLLHAKELSDKANPNKAGRSVHIPKRHA